MKENVKRVFYVRQVAHPCYLDIIAQRPEIRLDKLENETPDEVVATDHRGRACLPDRLGARRAQAAIPRPARSARAHAQPARRLHQRRRLRHRQRQGLHRRRRARRQPVRRQCRGGGVARARDDADALEADHPDQPRPAARHHARPLGLHRATTCTAAPSASSGSAMSAAAWPSSAAACSACR